MEFFAASFFAVGLLLVGVAAESIVQTIRPMAFRKRSTAPMAA
ncbi:hypothetical protein ABIC83_002552 [Roseateles asaccharophilus]